VLDPGHHIAIARQVIGQGGERSAGLVKPGESTTRGRSCRRSTCVASWTALVRVVINTSNGTPVMPPCFWRSSDSIGVMYRARRPLDGSTGYHRETMSSRAVASWTQGSWRETSFRQTDVAPTGWGPVGLGQTKRTAQLIGTAGRLGHRMLVLRFGRHESECGRR
jgi:hypothetical protein